MASNESQAVEAVPSEELPEASAEPTMINVRSQGLKLDLVLLQNRVSGLTIDYQGISESKELHKWIKIIDGMLSGSVPSHAGSNTQTLDGVAGHPASQPRPPKEEQKEPAEENDYRKVVLHAVDVSLDTLGNDGKHAILSLLENRYGLREQDIPDHPRGFVVLLDELLGASSQNLEREIMSSIRRVWAAPGEDLETVVESLKEHYLTAAPVEAAAEDPRSFAVDFSPVAIATTEEQEGPSESGMRNPEASDDTSPVGPRLIDPIPVGFKYNATYYRRGD
ncbi:MAG: hypothetical protein ABSB29_09715 [Nitrososphaerales archaeon]|jgi:hypothetical protein